MNVVENLAAFLRSQGHEIEFFFPGRALVLHRSTFLGFPAARLRLTVPFGQPNPIRSALAFPVLFPIMLFQLLVFLRRQRIQIINLHYLVDSFFYFAICKRLLSLPLVTSLHGSDAFYKGRPRERYSRPFKFALRFSDLIILPCDAYRKLLVSVFPGVQAKSKFIHNGVDLRRFSSAQTGQSIDSLGRYILCIAYLEDYKGIDILLNAAKPLLAGDSSLKLIIAGDGPRRRDLEHLASSLRIQSQTEFVGSQGSTEIAKLLQGCELLVLPSREEAFGIVILEAMASKRAVVATAVGGIPEVIEHEVSGILVEPENPTALCEGLRRVLTNSALKNRLAENGHTRVNRFSIDLNGAAYQAAFASLLGFPLPSNSRSEVSANRA